MMSLAKVPHRYKGLLIAIGASALLSAGAVAGVVLLLSGVYSTAATKQHYWITYRTLELGLHFSVGAAADGIAVPDLDRVADVQVGHACYREHCLQCHGAPGIAPDGVGRGQLPAAGSLSQTAREWSAARLFYVMQKGIRMSGMPAWEYRISEAALWSTVAYLQLMPSQTREAYARFALEGEDRQCPVPRTAQPYSTRQAQVTLRQYACDTCHIIPDMVGPLTHIGPSLVGWSQRKYIAGVLPNTRKNLVRWILDPHAVSPHTLMPDLEVTEAHAETMARYLLRTNE